MINLFEGVCSVLGSLVTEGDDLGNRLFRLSCLGNPEKTMQGEIHCQLTGRLNNLNVVSEVRWHAVNANGKLDYTSPDLLVFDRRWTPLLAIELKHCSANQSKGAEKVLGNVEGDRKRSFLYQGQQVPVATIAILTTVVGICQLGSQNAIAPPYPWSPLYTFLTAYAVKNVKGNSVRPQVSVQDKFFESHGVQLVVKNKLKYAYFTTGQPRNWSQYQIPMSAQAGGVLVKGRVQLILEL